MHYSRQILCLLALPHGQHVHVHKGTVLKDDVRDENAIAFGRID